LKAHNRANLVGKRFGLLTVVRSAKTKNNRSRWVCKCDCGGKCLAIGHDLNQGKVTSCKCLQRAASKRKAAILSERNELAPGEASFNLLYSTYKHQARRCERVFELTKEEFRTLTSSPCLYCGAVPSREFWGSSCKTPYICNGVDRQDNEVGYTTANSVSCCKICNWMKRVLTVSDFIEVCLAVARHQAQLVNLTNAAQ
jgi:hypothetical protein